MRLGIDIDDTITNSSDVFVSYAKKYNKENNIDFLVNNETLDVKLSFGWNENDYKKFTEKYLEEILTNVAPEKDSIAIINKLKQEKNEIIFITARSESEIKNNMFDLTKKWLNKNNYQYDMLITESSDKLNECIKNKIDLFIDDNYYNCRLINEKLNIPVILFTTRYNNSIKEDNSVIRVHNWQEIYDRLREESYND